MHQHASTDHGTVLRSDQSALVLDADGGVRLLLAQGADDAPATRGLVLITAIAIKLIDPDFQDELLKAVVEAHNDLQ